MSAPPPGIEQGATVTLEPLYVIGVLIFTLYSTRFWPCGSGYCAEKQSNVNSHISLLRKLPFLAELGRFVSILLLYRLSAWVCYVIWGVDSSQALVNALRIVRIQTFFFMGDIERNVQSFAWSHPYLMIFLNRVYKHCHIPGTVTFLAYVFITDRPLYRRWIVPFYFLNVIAFITFAAYPCTPPRLIPSLNIIDTMHTAPYGLVNEFQDTRFANQHAAVPSMHIGWSMFVACGLALAICRRRHRKTLHLQLRDPEQALRRQTETTTVEDSMDSTDDLSNISDAEFWQRYGPLAEGNAVTWYLCSAYSLVVLTSVLATGNHFLLDAVAGAAAAITAYMVSNNCCRLLSSQTQAANMKELLHI